MTYTPDTGWRCLCGKWDTYIGVYDFNGVVCHPQDGKTVRCVGCRWSINKCKC